MSELFQIETVLSPRLKWIEEHGIELHPHAYDEWEDKLQPWCAFIDSKAQGFGQTQDEALTALAIALKIKLWNE